MAAACSVWRGAVALSGPVRAGVHGVADSWSACKYPQIGLLREVYTDSEDLYTQSPELDPIWTMEGSSESSAMQMTGGDSSDSRSNGAKMLSYL